ncbi:hypothetical protein [Streptomyces anandii]|uniref:hypothetical protein n=1 Tax=Streptomyces anandii TaxID=285454 RepID=UPI0037A7F3CF
MLGLTTTRHLNAVRADLEAQLTAACLSAELERRRSERAWSRERTNLHGRLERAVRALSATRHDLATVSGSLRLISAQLLERSHG